MYTSTNPCNPSLHPAWAHRRHSAAPCTCCACSPSMQRRRCGRASLPPPLSAEQACCLRLHAWRRHTADTDQCAEPMMLLCGAPKNNQRHRRVMSPALLPAIRHQAAIFTLGILPNPAPAICIRYICAPTHERGHAQVAAGLAASAAHASGPLPCRALCSGQPAPPMISNTQTQSILQGACEGACSRSRCARSTRTPAQHTATCAVAGKEAQRQQACTTNGSLCSHSRCAMAYTKLQQAGPYMPPHPKAA